MELLTPSIGLIAWALFSLVYLILFIPALISALRNNFADSTIKLMWVLVVVMVPVIGPILYFTIGKNQIVR